MNAQSIKSFTQVHTWTGLGAGLALFVAFYAGALTVFTEEIAAWDTYHSANKAHQHYADAQQLIDRVLQQQPEVAKRLRLQLSQTDHPGNKVRWFQREGNGDFTRVEYQIAQGDRLQIDEDAGHLARFLYRLHYTAGLPRDIGLDILGFICVLYGMALLTGVLVFLPNFLRDLFIVRPGKNKKQFWRDTHNVVGMLSLPWHVMFAWSSALLAIGTIMLAPYQLLVFDDDLGQRIGPELGRIATPQASGEQAAMLSVAELVAIAQREVPGMEPSQLRFSHYGDSNSSVRLSGRIETEAMLNRVSVVLLASNGEVLNVSAPQNLTPGTMFYRGLISLHFADFDGLMLRWVYLLLGLAGAYLFYSGNLLWIETRRKRRRALQPAKTVFMARLNNGVCIGCMAAVSAAFVASRLFDGSAGQAATVELFYYGVFFAAIVWGFLRPVAAGARELLLLCALLTVLIPCLDIVLRGLTPRHILAAGQWLVFSVHAMSIIAALVFWRMAAAVKKRALCGEPNSVWCQPAMAGPEPGLGELKI